MPKREKKWTDIPGVAYVELRVEFNATGYETDVPEQEPKGEERRVVTCVKIRGEKVSDEIAMGLAPLVQEVVDRSKLLWDREPKSCLNS